MRTRPTVALCLAAALLVAAAALAADAGTPGGSVRPPADHPGPQFVTGDRCMGCHNQLTAPDGRDVSFGFDWRPSMMANAARDPYWQAGVRREVLDHPEASAAIQHECSACHMPMTRFLAETAGHRGEVFAHLPIAGPGEPGRTGADLLAADGVSCALCHRIEGENLGEQESFTAGFSVAVSIPPGERPVYGPYEVDAGRKRVMRSAVLFEPTKTQHLGGSELCATCHTLYTHALGPGGEVIGELPEQVPYLEWRHSSHAERGETCQSCHMPRVEGDTAITGVLGRPRPEVNRHVFRGGNFLMPKILDAHRSELGVQALAGELDAVALRTREHLATSAATVGLENVSLSGGRLRADVVVTNLAGHKLPSAYPSRRAWVHFVVRGASGETLFESGGLRPDGSIFGNDNDADPDRFEPHHAEIDSEDRVQIYEAILEGPGGEVTTGLLTAVTYTKDNRLLPEGFDKGSAHEDVAVHGRAAGDADFKGGSDRVRYRVEVPADGGPYRIEAVLRYQPIAFRWARNLETYDAVETRRFVRYFDELSEASATVLASAAATVDRAADPGDG